MQAHQHVDEGEHAQVSGGQARDVARFARKVDDCTQRVFRHRALVQLVRKRLHPVSRRLVFHFANDVRQDVVPESGATALSGAVLHATHVMSAPKLSSFAPVMKAPASSTRFFTDSALVCSSANGSLELALLVIEDLQSPAARIFALTSKFPIAVVTQRESKYIYKS